MLNPRLNRLELPGRREQYEGLIRFAISAAMQAMATQLHTASKLAVDSAAMWTDRRSAELLGEKLHQIWRFRLGVAGGEYYECSQSKPHENWKGGTRSEGHAPKTNSP
jgi:hypothetical protein